MIHPVPYYYISASIYALARSEGGCGEVVAEFGSWLFCKQIGYFRIEIYDEWC